MSEVTVFPSQLFIYSPNVLVKEEIAKGFLQEDPLAL